jgi:hypothetical protein
MRLKACLPIGFFGLASLAALALAPAHAFTPAASPMASPIACGRPVSSWGAATANDVRVSLLRVETIPTTSPGTPSAAVAQLHVLAELRFEHLGTLPAEIRLTEITLADCAGHRYAADVPPGTPAPGVVPVAPGQAQTLTVQFTVPMGTLPVRLIIPIHREGLTGGGVEFPLVALDRAHCPPAAAGAGEDLSSSATTSTDSPAEGRNDDTAGGQVLPGC